MPHVYFYLSIFLFFFPPSSLNSRSLKNNFYFTATTPFCSFLPTSPSSPSPSSPPSEPCCGACLPSSYFTKPFLQAGNPALLHYSSSAMETGEIGSPDHHFDDMQRRGKDSAAFTSAVTSASPAAVIIKLNTGSTNEAACVTSVHEGVGEFGSWGGGEA